MTAMRVVSLLIVTIVAIPIHAQSSDFLRTNPKFLHSFRDATSKAAPSVVRVECDGKETALGVIVGADGWVLTKAHDLAGHLRCKLKDGRALDANLVGVHGEHDLAMLKVTANGLRAIEWAHSEQVRSGSWVASVG